MCSTKQIQKVIFKNMFISKTHVFIIVLEIQRFENRIKIVFFETK